MYPRVSLLTDMAAVSRVIAFFSLQSMNDDAAMFTAHLSTVDKERVRCDSLIGYVSGAFESSFLKNVCLEQPVGETNLFSSVSECVLTSAGPSRPPPVAKADLVAGHFAAHHAGVHKQLKSNRKKTMVLRTSVQR